jgi:o-succinylbenzoate synthase
VNPFRAEFKKYTLRFVKPMGTSRGVLYDHHVHVLFLVDRKNPARFGLGECSPLPGLSIDARPEFAEKLTDVCTLLNTISAPHEMDLRDSPAIRFGLETALLDYNSGGHRLLSLSDFTCGRKSVPINGLVVMADYETMLQQAFTKIAAGFTCIKIKIGALDFDAELRLLREIRKHRASKKVSLRLDANGAFSPIEALDKLNALTPLEIDSLEQPIKAGQWPEMAKLCAASPIPIALDEELIDCHTSAEKKHLLRAIRPQYLILKPTLLGGFAACEEWMKLADEHGIGYWVTSALESNLGLNAISQWAATLPITRPQGLGTGQLYRANFPSPLFVESGQLKYSDSNGQRIVRLADLQLREFS